MLSFVKLFSCKRSTLVKNCCAIENNFDAVTSTNVLDLFSCTSYTWQICVAP